MSWKKGNRLPLVREADAQGHVREIFDEIKHTLGIPQVNVIFQVYAGYPIFLEMHWRAMRPALQTREFFDLAERLRADAYTRMHNYFEIPDFRERTRELRFTGGAQQELAEVIELFQYNNPLLLLIASAQMQAFDGPIGSGSRHGKTAHHPDFRNRPILVEESHAPAPIRKIYEDIKRATGLPVINTDYRGFARWPDFLQTYWHALRPVMDSPIYQQSLFAVRENAWQLARELPGPIELTISQLSEAGMSDDDIASVVRITELFSRALSSLVLNVALAKIGAEGGSIRKRKEPLREELEPKTPERAA